MQYGPLQDVLAAQALLVLEERELGAAHASPLQMELTGVVEHQGSFHGGHYTAYVRSGADQSWFYCSDTHTSEATERDVLGAQAFLLFYCRKEEEPPPAPTLRPGQTLV